MSVKAQRPPSPPRLSPMLKIEGQSKFYIEKMELQFNFDFFKYFSRFYFNVLIMLFSICRYERKRERRKNKLSGNGEKKRTRQPNANE